MSGLTNDEWVLLRGKMQMRVALLEVHRIVAGGRWKRSIYFRPNPRR